ncbi:hypothetical protein D3C81_2163780 [compost metagenome]
MPGHQRSIVIGAKVVPVFHHKMRLAGFRNLAHGRQATIRENILIDPRIDVIVGFSGSNAVEQKQTLWF